MLQQILIFDFIQTPNKCFFFKLSLSLGYLWIQARISCNTLLMFFGKLSPRVSWFRWKNYIWTKIYIQGKHWVFVSQFQKWAPSPIVLEYILHIFSPDYLGRWNFAYAKEGPFFTQLCCINSFLISSKLKQMLLFHTLSWKYLNSSTDIM